jgi:hypothetical protein
MSSSGFAARAQSAADKNDSGSKTSNSKASVYMENNLPQRVNPGESRGEVAEEVSKLASIGC